MDLSVWSWSTSIFYTLLVLLASTFAGLSQKTIKENTDIAEISAVKIRPIFLFIAFIIPWLVAGVRHDVASDYFSYIRIYNNVASIGLLRSIETLYTEPGYALLNWLIFNIFDDPQYVFIITSFIVFFIIYAMLLYNKEHIQLGLAVFIFTVAYYFWVWTVVRMSIALAIVFFSYKFIIKKDFFRFTMCVFLAFCFHYTALVVWPLYFLINSSKLKKLFYNVFFYGIVVFLLLFFNILFDFVFSDTKYIIYQARIGNLQGGLNQLIVRVPIFLVLVLYSKTLKKIDLKNIVYLKIYFIGIILSLFTFWLGILDRTLNYFFIVKIILLSSLVNIKSTKEKGIVILLVISYYILYFIYFVLTNERLIPYNTFWGWNF